MSVFPPLALFFIAHFPKPKESSVEGVTTSFAIAGHMYRKNEKPSWFLYGELLFPIDSAVPLAHRRGAGT